jgi:transcription elongation factor Elf1
MKIKLSATFEGKCSFCKKEKIVFSAGDEDTKRTVTICRECSQKMGSESLSEVIEKFGETDEKSFEEGVKYHKKPTAS